MLTDKTVLAHKPRDKDYKVADGPVSCAISFDDIPAATRRRHVFWPSERLRTVG